MRNLRDPMEFAARSGDPGRARMETGTIASGVCQNGWVRMSYATSAT